MTRRLFHTLVGGTLLLGLAGMRPLPSFAATTVSDCPTTETQLSADITTANSPGYNGTVLFTCPSPTTIPFTSPTTISRSVTLDASHSSGTVTFDGGGKTGLLIVNSGVTLTLKSLTLAHGHASTGGAIENVSGTVNISSSTLTGNSATISGGAITNAFGTVNISSSRLTGNSAATYGGAISNYLGTVSISASTLSRNSSPSGGAIYNTGGTMTISSGTLSSNSAANGGGAIYNTDTLNISSSTLTGNSATSGGAIYNSGGTASISSSTLSGNSATTEGGAIDNKGGTVSISASTLSGNSSPSGGAIYNNDTVIIASSTLTGNSATSGGAIFNYVGSTVTINSSTFSHNSATNLGGAIVNGGTMSISSSTLSGNSAGYGGAIFSYGTVSINSSTLSGNSAVGGAAIYNSLGTVSVGGTIIANSPKGGNCVSIGIITDVITDRGYNLSDDSSCGFSAAKHDLINTNPQLGPLQNNGGPTQTMALLSTSPAIDQIPTSVTSLCPASGGTDQRGYPRPDAGESVCDIGAYESSYLDTTTTLTSSANPSASGQAVTFTATVIPSSSGTTPTGTIRFSIDGKLFGSPVSLSGGKATSQPISSLAPGSHTIHAVYGGDANYLGSSGSLTQTVSPSHLSGSLSSSFHPIEGQSSSGPVATFTDTNTSIAASQLTATINWGDGTSSSGTVSGSNGHFVVSGSHSYADEGSFSASVTLQEQTPGRASGTVTGTIAVAEGDRLTPSTTSAPPATASRSYSGPVAAFSDTDTANTPSDFTASISWGDGTSSVGTVSGSNGHLVVSGSHTYSLPGRYTVGTTIRDDAPGTASATTATSLLVMVPGSSSGITVEADGTTDCTSVTSSTKVTSSGSPSGTFAFRDERPGGSPCGAYHPRVISLQAVGIDAVVCTSHTTASIRGRAMEGTYPNSSGSMVSFQAEVAITSQNSPFNGTVSIQTSSGYTSGAIPAAIHITGC